MSLIKWEPFNEFDRFFDDRFLASFSRPSWDLAVDVYEEKGNIVAKMSLPEVNTEDINISVEDNILVISAKRDEEKEIDKQDYYSKEIRRGSFSRSVRLPKSVEAAHATAEYKDGVLKISAPVLSGAEEKAVKIEITK